MGGWFFVLTMVSLLAQGWAGVAAAQNPLPSPSAIRGRSAETGVLTEQFPLAATVGEVKRNLAAAGRSSDRSRAGVRTRASEAQQNCLGRDEYLRVISGIVNYFR